VARKTGGLPRSSPISAAKDSAAFTLLFARPGRSEENFGAVRINENRCDSSIVSQAGESKKLPMPAGILGAKDVPVRGSEVDEVRMGLVTRQSAYVATIRSQSLPGLGLCGRNCEHENERTQ
jgi:hypothetical protein